MESESLATDRGTDNLRADGGRTRTERITGVVHDRATDEEDEVYILLDRSSDEEPEDFVRLYLCETRPSDPVGEGTRIEVDVLLQEGTYVAREFLAIESNGDSG